jgi:cysteine desulfurase/selenocysteine lyase
MSLNVEELRKQFPILEREVNGKPLVYLDNAATSLKPLCVSERLKEFYDHDVSNVHRGVHFLSSHATDLFEQSRKSIAGFIGARSDNEVVFTRGTTESANLVAQSFGRSKLSSGDEVIITVMEHHSNFVPWQMICEERGARLKVLDITDDGEIDLAEFEKLLSSKTKIVAVVHASNTLGTVNPVREICSKAKAVGAKVFVDAAQSLPCMSVNVIDLGCDFLAFSAHKMFGPHGLGVLWGKEELLNEMPPWQGGGSMIYEVSIEKTTFLDSPHRFEAGTPHISGVIAFSKAIEFLEKLGMDKIYSHEEKLLNMAQEQISQIPGIRVIGTAAKKVGILSFLLEGTHPNDVGTILDQQGIAVRTGHHCTQPLMKRYEIPATVRASFSIYNTESEVKALISGVEKAREMLL